MLQAHPKLGDIFKARIASMSPQEVEALIKSINKNNAGALSKLLPELAGSIGKAANGGFGNGPAPQAGGSVLARFGLGGSPPQGHQPMGGRPMPQMPQGGPGQGLARGGMPMLGHVAPPPRALQVEHSLPAEFKTNSRKYNTPTFARGGAIGMADGGNVGSAQQAAGGAPGLMNNPEIMQKLQNQNIAMQAVPQEGKADSVPMNASKGEFMMDTPSVMFYGMQKLIQMQEKAHEGMAEHMGMQALRQEQTQQEQAPAQRPGYPAGPNAQPRPPQGFAPPPPMMGRAVASAAGAPQPDATQNRIQATNTPRPQGGLLSPIK